MERDFMGLNSKDSAAEVKDSAVAKTSGSPWPFPDNAPAVPHFLRRISAQEDTAANQNLPGFLAKRPHAPSAASIAGLADPWNKSVGPPAQMTIFYNGTVRVYESITPEKAQAIMFLAGNGSCLFNYAGAQVRPATPKLAAIDVLPSNNLINAQPSSAMSSPMSVSSHNGAQSVSGSTHADEFVNKTSTPVPFSHDCKMDPPNPITVLDSAAAAPPSMIPRGIPQFRKVSLARFLEKRKERAMNAAPYNAPKKPECTS